MTRRWRHAPSRSALALLALSCSTGAGGPHLLVASQDLAPGARLTPSAVATIAVVDLAEGGPDAVEPEALEGLLGGELRVPLSKGDVLHRQAISVDGTPAEVAAAVHRHLRALTVAVTGADLVHQGDRVDLLYLTRHPARKEEVAVGSLQNVVVLAVGPLAHDPGPPPRFPLRQVTLEVGAEEAQDLAFAEDAGLLQVLVRNSGDLALVEEPGLATVATILSGEREKVRQLRDQIICSICLRGNSPSPSPDAGP